MSHFNLKFMAAILPLPRIEELNGNFIANSNPYKHTQITQILFFYVNTYSHIKKRMNIIHKYASRDKGKPPYFEACPSTFHVFASLHCRLHLLLLEQLICQSQPQVPHCNFHNENIRHLTKPTATHPMQCI